jgi:hypothetical protein
MRIADWDCGSEERTTPSARAAATPHVQEGTFWTDLNIGSCR